MKIYIKIKHKIYNEEIPYGIYFQSYLFSKIKKDNCISGIHKYKKYKKYKDASFVAYHKIYTLTRGESYSYYDILVDGCEVIDRTWLSWLNAPREKL